MTQLVPETSLKMTDAGLCGVESMALSCLQVIHKYSWLLDSFVLEFFTQQHWNQMPESWQSCLRSIQPEDLGNLVSSSGPIRGTKVWPLSLLALRSVVQLYMLPRQPNTSVSSTNIHLNSAFEWLDVNLKELESETTPTLDNVKETAPEQSSVPVTNLESTGNIPTSSNTCNPGKPTQCITNPSLKNLFVKHVKPKKRHEIVAMAKVCSITAQHVKCSYVVDVGAGKGHLSRVLSYGYGLKVCCLEAQSDLTETARKLDEELEYTARKRLGEYVVAALPKPTHINILLDSRKSPSDFVKDLREAFDVPAGTPFAFGIVGLHPCGDLAPALLHIFSACEEAKFISIVGCCYMKLTLRQTETTSNIGLPAYPLSKFFNSLSPQLASQSYEALEIACHAIEEYTQRLRNSQYSDLKIHNYRAVLEQIIVSLYPGKRRLGLRGVKNAHKMEFPEYAKVALTRAGLEIGDESLLNADIQNLLLRWKNVVVFYTLRLLVAPLVETAVLLDRLLFLGQKGYECCIIPGFDPILSPRNHVLLGCKN